MVSSGEFGGADYHPVEVRTRADEKDNPTTGCNACDDAAGATEIGGGGLERDDVDAFADSINIRLIGWVPKRGAMAEVGLIREEKRKSDVAR